MWMLAPPHLDVLAQPRLLGDRRRRVRLGRERRLRRRRPPHRGVVWRHHHLSSPDLAHHAVVCEGRVQENQRHRDRGRGRPREWAEEHDARTERKRSEKHGWFCQLPSSVLTRLPFHTGMRFTPPTRFESSCLHNECSRPRSHFTTEHNFLLLAPGPRSRGCLGKPRRARRVAVAASKDDMSNRAKRRDKGRPRRGDHRRGQGA